MKKSLLFAALIASAGLFAQDPVVQNSTFEKIAKNSGSACSCSHWINKDLGDQGESSSLDSDKALKFDAQEADLIYQEVAVLANTEYKLTFINNFDDDDDVTASGTNSELELRILKGSGYVDGYNLIYYTDATAKPTSGFGYEEISEVELAANNITIKTVTKPASDYDEAVATEITFNSGNETSIAILVRGTGLNIAPVDGKSYDWSSGDQEIRLTSITLINNSPLAITESFSTNFSIFPNPAKDVLNITSVNSIEKAVISDLSGKIVISKTSLKNKSIDVSSLPKGVYVLTLESGDVVGKTKFLKE